MVNERESNSCPRNISQRMINSPLFCAHSHIISMKNIMGSWPKMREMCYMIGEWFGMIQSFAWPLFMCLPYVCHLVSFDFICSIGRNLELILIYSSWNVELKNHWFFFHRKIYLQLSTYICPTKKLNLRQVRLLASDHLTETGVESGYVQMPRTEVFLIKLLFLTQKPGVHVQKGMKSTVSFYLVFSGILLGNCNFLFFVHLYWNDKKGRYLKHKKEYF